MMGSDNLVKQDEGLWIEQLPDKVDDITKFKLYETRSNFYMIGRNRSKTEWRVLKIDRSETSELSIIEDSTTYSEMECKELLQRLKDGNKSIGGLKFVTKCYGIVGFIRFLGPYYMLLITKKRKIGEICGHAVFSITQSMMIPIPHSTENCDRAYSKNENRYKKLLRSVDLTKDFFFSYSYKIMLSLQKNLSNTKPKMGIYDTMFVWNEFLTRGIRNQLKNSLWTVPLVQGFFKQVKHRISGREFFLTLIARRSRHYAGTRYLKRGVNEKGRVANDVETEQIVSDDLREGSATQISSVVQNRGSIPLFWSQETSKLFIKPDIILSRKDSMYKATKLHFQNLTKRYGNPIIIFNLIKAFEKTKPRESILRAEFANAIDVINKELTEENELKYLHWDLSKHSRVDTNALERLVDLAAGALECTGIFYCQLAPTSQMKKSLNPLDSKDFHTNPPKFQRGVVRTNCIDCLDRTNVAQYAYGLVALGHQLHALGFINAPFISLNFPLAGHLMKLYEEMGDILALQYGGSEAHNKMFSEKRGQWKATTQSQGLIKSIKRYCSNAYMDHEKQNAINVFLGHFQPQPLKPALWELDSDNHHNVGRHDYEFAKEKSRLIIKRSLSDGVMVQESSSSLEDGSIGKKQSSNCQSLDNVKSENAGLPVSESSPEISNCDGNISYSRYTPSLSGGKIFHAMQQGLECPNNSLSLSEQSETFDYSNFLDLDEIYSSGNSCEDLYERSSVLGSSCSDMPCFGSRTELRIKSLHRFGSSSLSPLGKETCSAANVDLGFEQSHEVFVSADPFEKWVMNGDTFFV